MKQGVLLAGLLGVMLVVARPTAAQTQTITVSTAAQLQSAVSSANSAGGNRTILIADGTYTLTDTLYVNAPNISLVGQSSRREGVVIQGDGMSASAVVGNLIRVAGNGFQLRYVTLQRSRQHLIQIVGESNTDNPSLRDCILRDAYQQMVKVSIDTGNTSVSGDNGLVENCVFEYTAGVAPQYYVGGIDAHGAKNWTVRNNTFRSIISPGGSVAEFAVHFWNTSANNLVENNVIINCDRGIGFGMDTRGNSGGIIRNNMIYHAAGNGQFADTGIALIESPGTQVYNNTVISDHSFPWTIEYRFSQTSGIVVSNNLVNKPIQARDGATAAVLSGNVTNAASSWFRSASTGDLHLLSTASGAIDRGVAVSGLTADIDGQARPAGSAVDVGADEFVTAVAPNAPTNLIAQ